MFFEGAEKKVEIVVSEDCWPLTNRPREYWVELVHACGATILSEVENQDAKAFLLSESSLFVWKDRVLMLTCGQTRLVESVLLFLKKFGTENIESIVFQRKNEYRSRLQPSDFRDDVEKIRTLVDGVALRFGKIHGHYNLLFYLNRHFHPSEADTTTEFFMYDISASSGKFLTQSGLRAQDIRSYFKLENIFEDFIIDDFAFQPYGYSLNAIKDDLYYTIHVTPQETSPYVSFETNIRMGFIIEKILHHFIDIFEPGSFDVVTFNSKRDFDFGEDYLQIAHTRDHLLNGYDVDFRYFYRGSKGPEKPVVY